MDQITIQVEINSEVSKEDLEALGKDIFKLRANIEIVQENSLPKDGKVIDDQRDYS